MSDFSLINPQMPARASSNEVAATAAMPASLAAILGRIEEAVDEETALINTDSNFDLKASNARKGRYLYELTRVVKGIGETVGLSDQHRGDFVRLRQKLESNEAAILARLNAVNEVATLLQNAIQHSEADGTYSAGEFGVAG